METSIKRTLRSIHLTTSFIFWRWILWIRTVVSRLSCCNILHSNREIITLALFCDSCDENELKEHPFWININALFARLTRARVCDFQSEARERCNFLVNNTSIRSSPVLFSLALCAAAQHIIYSGSEVYEYSNITSENGHCEWMSWKEAFISAEKNGTLNIEAHAHARLALRAMTKVEMNNAIPKMQYCQSVTLSKKRDHQATFEISSSKANPVTKDGEMTIGQPVYVYPSRDDYVTSLISQLKAKKPSYNHSCYLVLILDQLWKLPLLFIPMFAPPLNTYQPPRLST